MKDLDFKIDDKRIVLNFQILKEVIEEILKKIDELDARITALGG